MRIIPESPRRIGRLNQLRARRDILALLIGAATALTAGGAIPAADARKKRKKKKVPPPPVAPTCAQLCPDTARFCVHRLAGQALCGADVVAVCNPCTSDQDCLSHPGLPFCITAFTERATETAYRMINQCPGSVGACAAVVAP